MIPTNNSNWWKRIRKGDILETGGHVVLVYSVPDTSDDSLLIMIHACGFLYDIDEDGEVDFTRKTIISPFYIWGLRRGINNPILRKGRIKLWR